MNEFNHRSFLSLQRERPQRDSNPDFCDVGAVLHQFSYRANWEYVVVWDGYTPNA